MYQKLAEQENFCQFVPISVKSIRSQYGINVYQKRRQKINVKIHESCSDRKSAIWVFYNLLVTRAQKMMVSEAAFLSSDVTSLIRISSESINRASHVSGAVRDTFSRGFQPQADPTSGAPQSATAG
jgi:hypothetical protein